MPRECLSYGVRILLAISSVLLTQVDARAATWTTSTVETNGSGTLGFYSSIALDSQSLPRIAYSQQMGGTGVRYAASNGGGWTIEQVNNGERPSLALTSQDEPRIAYRVDSFPPETRLARKVGSTWFLELIDTSGAETWRPSLALMANDNPAVAFRGGGGGFLNYAYRGAMPPWTIEVPASFENNMNNSLSLDIDALGNPRIAFTDGVNLEYVEKTAGVWTSTIVANTGEDCALALDGLNNPHISLFDEDTGDLRYARRVGGVWTIESVDTAGVTGTATAIALDGSGSPYIAYSGGGALRFAYRAGGAWNIEVVNPSVQGYPSIDVDAQGRPHLSFLWSGALRYAFREAPITDVPASSASGISLRAAPNPVGAEGTSVSFAIPGEAGSAELAVFDVTGRRIRTFALTSPSGSVRWNGVDDNGRLVADGLYLLRLRSAAGIETRRVSVVR